MPFSLNDFPKTKFTLKIILASLRVLVDGGANRWFDFVKDNDLDERMALPNILSGDMDSITEESYKRLGTMGCERICTPDQNDTDCTKSLNTIRPRLEPKKVSQLN